MENGEAEAERVRERGEEECANLLLSESDQLAKFRVLAHGLSSGIYPLFAQKAGYTAEQQRSSAAGRKAQQAAEKAIITAFSSSVLLCSAYEAAARQHTAAHSRAAKKRRKVRKHSAAGRK